MMLRAELHQLNVFQALNLVRVARKTGRLAVEGPDGRAHLYLREGRLIGVEMPDRVPDLNSYLMEAGRLSGQDAQGLQARSMAELAVLLVESGRATQEEVMAALRRHHRDMACELVTWSQGSLTFEPEVTPPEGTLAVEEDLEQVLVAGQRRLQEWERLRQEIPRLDVTLRFPDGEGSPPGHVDLSAEEWAVISSANTGLTLAEVAVRHRLSDYRLRRAVSGVLRRGLVELSAAQPAGQPEPEAEEEERRRGLFGRFIGG